MKKTEIILQLKAAHERYQEGIYLLNGKTVRIVFWTTDEYQCKLEKFIEECSPRFHRTITDEIDRRKPIFVGFWSSKDSGGVMFYRLLTNSVNQLVDRFVPDEEGTFEMLIEEMIEREGDVVYCPICQNFADPEHEVRVILYDPNDPEHARALPDDYPAKMYRCNDSECGFMFPHRGMGYRG